MSSVSLHHSHLPPSRFHRLVICSGRPGDASPSFWNVDVESVGYDEPTRDSWDKVDAIPALIHQCEIAGRTFEEIAQEIEKAFKVRNRTLSANGA